MKSKVAIVKCGDYDREQLYRSLKEALGLLGGIESCVRPGQNVLLKPNLLSQRPAESGVNTHPEFVRAMIRIVREARGAPLVGDSPGGTVRDAGLVYERCGIKEVCEEEKCPLVKFDRAISINGMPVADWIKKVDLIINLPKAKTHNQTIITGAVKNTFGCICGLAKVQYHLNFPNPAEFAKVLVDIYELVKPAINVMDAICAMEGEGPAAGPLRNMGLIIAGENGVAVDAVFCHLIGLNPHKVAMLALAQRRGLGTAAIGEIEVLGQKLDDAKAKNFALPAQSILSRIPGFLLRPARTVISFRPAIDESLCRRCRICEESCPTRAIEILTERCSIDYGKCIRCMCCFELCPHNAIGIKRSLIAKAITRNWIFKREKERCSR